MGLRFTGSVINNMVLIASFLGYKPLFLVGTDYAWKSKTITRANTWSFNKKNELVMGPILREKKNEVVINIGKHRTAPNHFSFKVGLLETFKNIDATIIDCSDGILTEFPKVNFEKVVEEQGMGNYGFNKEEVLKKIDYFFKEEFLKYRNLFEEKTNELKKKQKEKDNMQR